MNKMETKKRAAFRRHAIAAAALALGGVGGASAIEIDTGNPDLTFRWDNTVRYTLGVRTEGQDNRILSNPGYDESDGKFGRYDIVTNRVDLFTEFDLNYKSMVGGRLTGAAWYDNAYSNKDVTPFAPAYTTSYYNNTYNSTAKRYTTGPSGELLDAFVWGNVKLGDVPVNVKVGRHANVWGEGLLMGSHAISYSQAPLDGTKASATPGIETKEVFLPIGQVSAKAQVTDALSIAGQYFYEWESTRGPHGGTYLASADTSMQVDRLWNPQLAAFVPGGVLNRVAPLKPGNTGNWGVNARLNVEAIESTFGLYYREFDDYTPSGVQTQVPTASFRFVYPTNIKLYGFSFARVIGPVSFGSEISLRKNAALNNTSLADGIGPRGDTIHAVANGIYLLPATKFWDTGSLVAEVAYNQLRKVTTNAQWYKAEGYACAAGQDRTFGCSTKRFVQVAVNFTPQYLGIFPSWDLDVPLSVNYGVSGVSPNAGGSSGAATVMAWSAGARLTYAAKHEFTLRYADQTADTRYGATGLVSAGRGNIGLTDRGWLSFTYKTGF